MNLQDLLSGIAVVIDDALDADTDTSTDSVPERIVEIVTLFENRWGTPFYKADRIPPNDMWDSLLESATFVLLDWKLWDGNAPEVEELGIAKNLAFLEHAKDYSVPVFIFTNEDIDYIAYRLRELYEGQSLKKSFVFIQRKNDLWNNGELALDALEAWVSQNASVYALKTWDAALRAARTDLFGTMYARNPDWPRVFWREYEKDGVDPSWALTELINDSLRGRMRADHFKHEALNGDSGEVEVPSEDLHALLSATSFLETVPEHEVRCGDLFDRGDDTFLLNIRPDCDCIPRDDVTLDEIDLYCIEGRAMTAKEIRDSYSKRGGYFRERVYEAIVFAAGDGRSIMFDFNDFSIEKFEVLKGQRIGRVLHPYVTKIQQRYALFLQRQGLPRVPGQAVSR